MIHDRGRPARIEGTVEEAVDGGLVVLDPTAQRAHSLDQETSRVWQACDGTRDIHAIASLARVRPEDAEAAVARLEVAGLLQGPSSRPSELTRRSALKRTAAIGGAAALAAPIVTVLIPPAYAAASESTVTLSGSGGSSFTYLTSAGVSGTIGPNGTIYVDSEGHVEQDGTTYPSGASLGSSYVVIDYLQYNSSSNYFFDMAASSSATANYTQADTTSGNTTMGSVSETFNPGPPFASGDNVTLTMTISS